MIIGDPVTVAQFYSHIPGSQYTGNEFWDYPCDAALPSISFYIAGQEFPLTNFDIVRQDSASNRCIGAIMERANTPYWVLGFAFMAGYYTVFDVGNAKVGFATLAWAM
jgi:hypothetical protein